MELIAKYFPDISENQREQFRRLDSLYKEWNSKINLISRRDIDALYEKHVLHSLAIAKTVSFKPATKVLDVGTGGGFPGIPLAILFPHCRFHLVDSIGKKIIVVKDIIKQLGLSNASAEQIRAENVYGKYHFIVSRAVTDLKKFTGWIEDKVEKNNFNDLINGILYLKGGDLTEELNSLNRKTKVYDIDFFEEEFFRTKKVVYVKMSS